MWGERLRRRAPRRFCPDCGAELDAGRARCRSCFLEAEERGRDLTDRMWIRRNFPGRNRPGVFPKEDKP